MQFNTNIISIQYNNICMYVQTKCSCILSRNLTEHRKMSLLFEKYIHNKF